VCIYWSLNIEHILAQRAILIAGCDSTMERWRAEHEQQLDEVGREYCMFLDFLHGLMRSSLNGNGNAAVAE
jgi:hypothetical protein